MLYVTLSKITNIPQGVIDIAISDISAWEANYNLVEADETFRGKQGYEIIYETGGTVRLATSQEIIEATKEDVFSSEQFLHRLSQEFTTLERLTLSKLVPSFTSELQFHNFAEIHLLRDYLVSEQLITQAQADTLTALFAEQNIDLDSYGTTGV
jgi:hypothetical protein